VGKSVLYFAKVYLDTIFPVPGLDYPVLIAAKG
jgi:hypothetical protein